MYCILASASIDNDNADSETLFLLSKTQNYMSL